MTILTELIAFIRRPVFTSVHVPMTGQSIIDLFKLLGLTFVLATVSVMISAGLYVLLVGAPAQHSEGFNEALTRGDQFFIAAVLIGPVIEELLFRSWLGKVWSILLIMPTLLCFSAVLILASQMQAAPRLSMIGVMIVMGSLGLYLSRYHQTKSITDVNDELRHDAAVRAIFPYVFWTTTVLFALLHMSNYAQQGFTPFLMVLVIPQFIIGTIFGFVRMRFGVFQAIGFHGVYNGLFVGLFLLN
ncbi:MAG: CPBP family glutamic-type intramembrane protease [Litorimonas sp.]